MSVNAREHLRLAPEELRRRCDPAALGFRTTAEVEPEDGVIVSARQTFAEALAAVQEPRDDAELVPALEELARASTALVEALSGR